MAVKLSISLNEQVLEDLDLWCASNGNLKRSHAIAFMTTQWLQGQKNINMMGEMLQKMKETGYVPKIDDLMLLDGKKK